MDRKVLQTLSILRIREAEALLSADHFSGAYYLAGYSVECGIKACIASSIKRHVVQQKGFEGKFFIHNLDELAKHAGLIFNKKLAMKRHQLSLRSRIEVNWATVKDWKETARYSEWSEREARDLVAAVNDPNEGVFQWVQAHW